MSDNAIPPAERRATLRHAPTERDTFCQAGLGTSDQFWWFAKVIDISLEGVGLVTNQGFKPGEHLFVELAAADGSVARTLQVRVVHASEQPGGWILGCSFVDKLDAQELQALL